MDLKIHGQKFETSEIGNLFKSSKCIYSWEFVLDDNRRKIELTHSRISWKRRVTINGKELVTCRQFNNSFSYSFPLEKHYITIVQTASDAYDLRIDNLSFAGMIATQNVDKVIPKENKEKIPETEKVINSISSDNYGKMEKKKSGKKKTEEDFFAGFDHQFGEEPKKEMEEFYKADLDDFEFDENKKNKNKVPKKEKASAEPKTKNTADADWDFDTKPKQKPQKEEKVQQATQNMFDFDKVPVVSKSEKNVTSGVSNTNTNQGNLIDWGGNNIFSPQPQVTSGNPFANAFQANIGTTTTQKPAQADFQLIGTTVPTQKPVQTDFQLFGPTVPTQKPAQTDFQLIGNSIPTQKPVQNPNIPVQNSIPQSNFQFNDFFSPTVNPPNQNNSNFNANYAPTSISSNKTNTNTNTNTTNNNLNFGLPNYAATSTAPIQNTSSPQINFNVSTVTTTQPQSGSKKTNASFEFKF